VNPRNREGTKHDRPTSKEEVAKGDEGSYGGRGFYDP
jgi:hypothetical protein